MDPQISIPTDGAFRRLSFDGLRRDLPALAIATASLLVVLVADTEMWGDEQHVIQDLARWSPGELFTQLPVHKAQLPTWYFIPEFLGVEAALLLSFVSLPVTVYTTIRAGEALFDRRSAHLAGALVAGSPFLIEQATWVRMYAPLTAVMAVGLCFALEERWRAAAAAFLLASTLHVFGWFGPVWLALVTARERPRFASAVLVTGSIPNIWLAGMKHFGDGLSASNLTVQTVDVSHARVMTLIDAGILPMLVLVSGAVLLLSLPLLIMLAGVIINRSPTELQLFTVLPIVGIGLASWIVFPVYVLKYFGFIAPAVALMAARPGRPRQRAVIVLVLVMSYAMVWSDFHLGTCQLSIHADRCAWVKELKPSVIARRVIVF